MFIQHPKEISVVITTLLANAKTISNPLTVVPLLGTAVDVTLRLKNVKDESLKSLEPSLKVCIFLNSTYDAQPLKL